MPSIYEGLIFFTFLNKLSLIKKFYESWVISLFIVLPKEKILKYKESGIIESISLWDTISNAESYYSNYSDLYVGYFEDQENLQTAYSTPVKVYQLKL